MTAFNLTTQVQKKYLDKIKGGIIGFMIGDALGLPIAGIPKQDVLRTVGTITAYVENPNHPLLFYLKKGQYGANSRLLLASLQVIINNKKYVYEDHIRALKEIATKSESDAVFARWMGVTIMKSLITSVPSNTDSCTCIYGAIPIALLYDDLETVISLSELQSKITHVSSISLSASIIISYIVYQLKRNDEYLLSEVVSGAIEMAEKKYGATLLTKNISMIIKEKILSLHHARKVFGTGSRADQSIPLAIYIALNNRNDPKKGILEGVNSFRDDTPEEIKRLKGFSYDDALIQCRGGAGDVVGGLVGCMLGTLNGYLSLPNEYKEGLEDEVYITSLIDEAFI